MAQSALAAVPIRAGGQLTESEWREIRERVVFEFCKWDLQCEDHAVLGRFPLLVASATARFLNEKAEALAREALAAEDEIRRRPTLLAKLALPRAIRRELERSTSSSSWWPQIRVMRFDFHPAADGWRISEVNADVPGGFIEASGCNGLFAEKWSGASAPPDTSDIYAEAIEKVAGKDGLVAFVHATAYSDDRQVMQYLARRFALRGMRASLCSPSHLRWRHARAALHANFASGAVDAIVRFFPCEWLPNLATEDRWRPYFQGGQTPLSNPGHAIVLQTKRFPLVWNDLRVGLTAWRELLPETRSFSELRAPSNEDYVVKPALGRVGEDVGIRGVTPKREFEELLARARRRPEEWVAQDRFEIQAIETPDGPLYPCLGVFTIGGKASGFYGRISKTPIIARDAQDVAVLISDVPLGERN